MSLRGAKMMMIREDKVFSNSLINIYKHDLLHQLETET